MTGGETPLRSEYLDPAADDRWTPLLLDDGEYLFADVSCDAFLEPPSGDGGGSGGDGANGGAAGAARRRVAGHLKVASRSLVFVPRDARVPVMRLPYRAVRALGPVPEDAPAPGRDAFRDAFAVEAAEVVEMRPGGRDVPYRRGPAARLVLSPVFAALDDVLPLVDELRALAAAAAGGGRAERGAAAARLAELVAEAEAAAGAGPAAWLDDGDAVAAEAPAARVAPLCVAPGRAAVTRRAVCFQPALAGAAAPPVEAWPLGRVTGVARRAHQLEDVGLELFFGAAASAAASLFLAFRSRAARDGFEAALRRQPALRPERLRGRRGWTADWVAGRVSNFDYLLFLNREAGRSFQDLSQYPVFPWVLADYTSPALDLADPASFRDLSKPVGALNPARLAHFRERYAELARMAAPPPRRRGRRRGAPAGAPPPLDTPPFLYGCHYSSPGYVVHYLMRSRPALMLRLQDGRFDAPDRLFTSVAGAWRSVTTLPSDVKELTPEFYSGDTSFLVAPPGADFGAAAGGGGAPVGDVALPPWAADAADFAAKMRAALESPAASARLHRWIDLVFGCRSRGAAARRADNVFHPLTYDDVASARLAAEPDAGVRAALRLQMAEFGRTPRQLFARPHPRRRPPGRGPLGGCLCGAPPPAAADAPPPPAPPPAASASALGLGRGVPPAARAVLRLTSASREKRGAALQYLERLAAANADALSLRPTSGAELPPLLAQARAAAAGALPHLPAAEGAALLARAARALAAAPPNRRYLLDAGAVGALVAALAAAEGSNGGAGGAAEVEVAALTALAALAEEADARAALAGDTALLEAAARAVGAPRGPPEALPPALALVGGLAKAAPARAWFAARGVPARAAAHLEAATARLAELERARASAAACGEASPLPSARSSIDGDAARLRSHWRPHDAAEARALAAGRAAGLALAALLADGAPAGDGGCLPAVLAACGSGFLQLRGAGYECLAALTAADGGARAAALGDAPLLAGLVGDLSVTPVARPAAACVATVCADAPAAADALAGLGGGGAWAAALVGAAGAADADVRRYAAAALWHLLAAPRAAAPLAAAGALGALARAAAATGRGGRARALAAQALRRAADDPALRPALEAATAEAGLDLDALKALAAGGHSRTFSFASSFGGASTPTVGGTPTASVTPRRSRASPSAEGCSPPGTGGGASANSSPPLQPMRLPEGDGDEDGDAGGEAAPLPLLSPVEAAAAGLE